jgi:hypothetical protein
MGFDYKKAASTTAPFLNRMREIWRGLPAQGWPVGGGEFLDSPPRWFVRAVFLALGVIATPLLLRLLYALILGSADEVNKYLLAVAGLVGAPFLVWRTWIADRQRHVAQEELYTGLLVKAVEAAFRRYSGSFNRNWPTLRSATELGGAEA